jgi:hypothetical protein
VFDSSASGIAAIIVFSILAPLLGVVLAWGTGLRLRRRRRREPDAQVGVLRHQKRADS